MYIVLGEKRASKPNRPIFKHINSIYTKTWNYLLLTKCINHKQPHKQMSTFRREKKHKESLIKLIKQVCGPSLSPSASHSP